MNLTRKETLELIQLAEIAVNSSVPLAEVAIRDAKDGDGDERGVYDDVLHSVSTGDFQTWSHNTNPSASYKRGLAELVTGLWAFDRGYHNISRPARKHAAFRQPDNVNFVVHRDGVGNDTGWFAINHHRGGNNGTSSLGCQTNPPGVWSEYQPWAYKQMGDVRRKPYFLLTADQARKILGGDYVPKFRANKTLWLAEKANASVQQPAPPVLAAPKETWKVYLPNGKEYSGIVKMVAGRPQVRTRLFARAVDPLDPRELEKTLAWDGEGVLTLAGNKVQEVTEDQNGDTYAPVRELAEACGFGLEVTGLTIRLKKASA